MSTPAPRVALALSFVAIACGTGGLLVSAGKFELGPACGTGGARSALLLLVTVVAALSALAQAWGARTLVARLALAIALVSLIAAVPVGARVVLSFMGCGLDR